MSLRYYLITLVLAAGITAWISYLRETRAPKDVAKIFFWVVVALGLVAGVVAGIAALLAWLGIAESGFV
jgi:hypothetical protein